MEPDLARQAAVVRLRISKMQSQGADKEYLDKTHELAAKLVEGVREMEASYISLRERLARGGDATAGN